MFSTSTLTTIANKKILKNTQLSRSRNLSFISNKTNTAELLLTFYIKKGGHIARVCICDKNAFYLWKACKESEVTASSG